MPVVCTYIHTNILLFRIYACMCVCVCENWAAGKKLLTHTKEKTLLDLPDCLWLRALVRLLSQRARERQRVRESELVSESKSEVGASSAFGLLHAIQYYSIRLRIKLVFHGVQRLREHAYIQKTRYIHIHTRMYVHTQIRVCVCVHACLLYVYFCCFDLIGAKECAIVRCVSCFWNNIENNRAKK